MPPATANPKVREAGATFRRMRTEAQWTLDEVQRISAERFGENNDIKKAQLSHIEKGDYSRPSLDDTVRLGLLFGLTPNEVAEMYGLYQTTSEERSNLPREFQELAAVWPALSFAAQEDILSWMQLALMKAKAAVAQSQAQPVETDKMDKGSRVAKGRK